MRSHFAAVEKLDELQGGRVVEDADTEMNAPKGPINERRLITSYADLVDVFGVPSALDPGMLAAADIVRACRQLHVVRVADPYAVAAQVVVPGPNPGEESIRFTASSAGDWANAPRGLAVVLATGSLPGTYRLNVVYQGQIVEQYDALNVSDPAGFRYIETELAASRYLSAEVLDTLIAPRLGTYNFAGGDSGRNVTGGDYIGSVVGGVRTGLRLLNDTNEISLNLVAVPGVATGGVANALLDFAETRQDCFAVIDPPFGLTAQEVADWHNGLSSDPDAPQARLDSSYGAMFWPWVQRISESDGGQVFVPPSAAAIVAMCRTDAQFGPWRTAAGPQRGRLTLYSGAERRVGPEEVTTLYGGPGPAGVVNAVNVIVTNLTSGLMINGQRTLQRAATSLDRINNRRTLLYLRDKVGQAVKLSLFEPNDERLWNELQARINPILSTVQTGRGLLEYLFRMDQSTNPPNLQAQNIANGLIFLRFTPTAERIQIGFVVSPQGVDFSELVSLG